MTWYYVYAIVPETTSLPSDLSGIFGESLTLVCQGGLAAVVGEGPEHFSDAGTASILKHHRVVAQLCERCPALPVQFGSLVQGEERIGSALEERQETLLSDLKRLAGTVEFGITIPGEVTSGEAASAPEHSEVPEPTSSGSDYMNRRLGEYQLENEVREEVETIRDALIDILGPLANEQTHELVPRAGILLRASYLVDGDWAQSFEQRVATFQSGNPSVELVLVGPWPPYSFVSPNGPDIAGMLGAINR